MSTLREIRGHIAAVQDIAKITRAMQMVASAHARVAQQQALTTRSYAEKAWVLLVHLADQYETRSSGLFPLGLSADRPVHKRVLVLITGDRGLCGAFNTDLIRRAQDFIEEHEEPTELICVGQKGSEAMARLGHRVIADFSGLPSRPRLSDVTPLARFVREGFFKGEFDEVWVVYSRFYNVMRHPPVVERLLPICREDLEHQAMGDRIVRPGQVSVPSYIYEPDANTLLQEIVPRFIEVVLYQIVLDSIASEQSARMVAMRNATESAQDMIHDLTLRLNKARQQSITMELMDIVGGVEGLRRAKEA